MTFSELVCSRFSARSFKPDSVDEALVRQILEAGRVAPTARNQQPQSILAVTSADGRERLTRCTPCHFGAPLAFIVGYDRTACWQRPEDGKSSGEIDACIVATHMMLAAASLGVGSTWVMCFSPRAVAEEFALPSTVEPVAVLVMGYPADDCRPSDRHGSRKPLTDTVRFV